MIDIPCVILSGGASRRMGEDKSLMPFGGFETLIEYQHNKLSKIFSKVYISAKTNKFTFDANLLLDQSQVIYSPMVALEAILSNISEDKAFITTVDVPFLEDKTFEILFRYSTNFEITIAKDKNHTHNLCGIFSKSLLPLIEELLQKDIHRISSLNKKSSFAQEIFFDKSDQFTNINTQDEYKKFLL